MAIDWESVFGGAATGGSVGGLWGAGAGALGGALFGGKGESTQAQPASYQWLQNPQYSFTEPRLRLASDFVSQQIERMGRGEFPAWYDKIAPQMKQQAKQGLAQQYQGIPGLTPGVLGAQEAYGVKRGLGRGAAAGETYGAQLQKWTEQANAVDRYIAQMGAGAQERGAVQFPQMAAQMPQGPQGQWGASTPYIPSQYEPSSWEQIMGMIGKMGGEGGQIDFSKLFGGDQQQGGQVLGMSGPVQEPTYPGQSAYGTGPGPATIQPWMYGAATRTPTVTPQPTMPWEQKFQQPGWYAG